MKRGAPFVFVAVTILAISACGFDVVVGGDAGSGDSGSNGEAGDSTDEAGDGDAGDGDAGDGDGDSPPFELELSAVKQFDFS